jgi:hypothetical protein
MLERDNAETFGPSERFMVCGFGFVVPVEKTNSELFISILGFSTSDLNSGFCKLLSVGFALPSETCLASTIE